MSEQSSLPGFDPPSPPVRPTDSLFFAFLPESGAAADIEQLVLRLVGKYRFTGTPIAAERLHVSIHHVGNYVGLPQKVVDAASATAASVIVPPLEIEFNRVMSFRKPGKNPLVLRGNNNVALNEFWQILGMAMARAGIGHGMKLPFTPHLTLLYDSRSIAEESVETIRWTAQEFVLVHSLLGKSRYIQSARWPLRG